MFPTGESNYRGVGVAKEPFFRQGRKGEKRENCPEIDFSVGKKPVVEVFFRNGSSFLNSFSQMEKERGKNCFPDIFTFF